MPFLVNNFSRFIQKKLNFSLTPTTLAPNFQQKEFNQNFLVQFFSHHRYITNILQNMFELFGLLASAFNSQARLSPIVPFFLQGHPRPDQSNS
jgi:hypothetical protein